MNCLIIELRKNLSISSSVPAGLLGLIVLGTVLPLTNWFSSYAVNQTGTANASVPSKTNKIENQTFPAYSNFTNSSAFLTYHNPDFGLSIQYPSNWTKQEDNLVLHTIVAFSAIHEDKYNFINNTWAEVDLRIYNAPQEETSAKLNINQINTQGQVIVKTYKNSTAIGGLPSLQVISYFFGLVAQKQMQIWTFIPSKNILLEVFYTALPSKYSFYLPAVDKMINSVKITH